VSSGTPGQWHVRAIFSLISDTRERMKFCLLFVPGWFTAGTAHRAFPYTPTHVGRIIDAVPVAKNMLKKRNAGTLVAFH
jgi:hypothetical protein